MATSWSMRRHRSPSSAVTPVSEVSLVSLASVASLVSVVSLESLTSVDEAMLLLSLGVEREEMERVLWMPESAFCGVSNSSINDVLLPEACMRPIPMSSTEWEPDDDETSLQMSEKVGKGSS